jgi:recombination associated protein RdgC
MADWLLAAEAPGPFSLEDEVQLEAQDDSRALVRYARLPLGEGSVAAEIRSHLAAGKRPTRLALAYADRLSFVLTADGALKRLARTDAEDETTGEARDARERFEGRFYLFAETLRSMLPALSAALGGELGEEGEQGKSSTSPISGNPGSQASSA